MKLAFKTSPTIASDDMVVSKMGIDASSADILTFQLRDKIYTDKVLAPIREYITNAWDEHIKYNVTRPVEVSITREAGSHIWKCRDFANGLSEEGVRTILTMYGASTKRDNNTQVGTFGLGAKSFMAYTDTFYVSSYHEGILTKYVCILGSGDYGTPVGEVYKVSEEPTTESGIEISAEIDKEYYSFERKTKEFVQNFLPDANIIFTDDYNNTYQPHIPKKTKTIDGYTFSAYPDIEDMGSKSYVAIRMGGVIYEKNHRFILDASIKDKIVVDVPIGKLTIPLSRETLEDTLQNRNTYAEIKKILQGMCEEDKALHKVPTLGECLTNGSIQILPSDSWFTYSYRDLFPDTYCMYNHITKDGYYGHDKPVNNTYTIFVLPNIKNIKNWLERLSSAMKTLNKPYLYVVKNTIIEPLLGGTDTLDVSNCIFIDIKKLGLPKLPKKTGKQVEFLTFFNGNKKTYSPENLEDVVSSKWFGDDEIEEDWHLWVEDLDKLNRRTIGLVEDFGTCAKHYTVNSVKMYDAMLEIGWISKKSKEYVAAFDRIVKESKRKHDIERAGSRLQDNLWHVKFSPLLVSMIGKNPDKVQRLVAVKDKITKEDSTRGRILASLYSSSYSAKFNRADLRKILLIKH